MNKKRPTIQQIADIVGISKNSVSKALRDSPKISKETKKRVKEVANELGYIPNMTSSIFRTNKSNVLAFIIDDFLNPFTFRELSSIQKYLGEENYIITTFLCNKSKLVNSSFIKEVCKNPIGGIITTLDLTDDCADLIKKLNMPILSIGIDISRYGFTSILFQDYKIGYEAGKKLYELGGSNFLYASGIEKKFEITQNRYKGFKDALLDLKVPENKIKSIFKTNKKTLEENIKDFNFIKSIDSFFCFCDLNAYTVLDATISNNKDINKINIIGVDNLKGELMYFPKISSFDEDLNELGMIVSKTIINLILNKHEKNIIYIDFSFNEGITTHKLKN